MVAKVNPFLPGEWVPASAFVGREQEIKIINRCVYNTKNGRAQNFLIDGERGIGKTSLMGYSAALAEGFVEPLESKEKFNFIVLSISLDKFDDYVDIIDKIFHQLCKVERVREYIHNMLDIALRIKVAGFEYRQSSANSRVAALLEELVDGISELLKRTGGAKDGVLMLIDEAEKPTSVANLGTLCKLLTESLSRRSVKNFMIGLAGQPSLIDKLSAGHESAPRIFQNLRLLPLSKPESILLIDAGVREANIINRLTYKFTDLAKTFICVLCEGYPHFLQEVCFHSFEATDNQTVTHEDVAKAVCAEHGVLDQMAIKYFPSVCGESVLAEERKLLDFMAKSKLEWIEVSYIVENLEIEDSKCNKIINVWVEKEVVIVHATRSDLFRLRSKALGVWLRAKMLKIMA